MADQESVNLKAQANWIADAIPERSGTVTSLVPPRYSTYVRILHLAIESKSQENNVVSWRLLADRLGVDFSPEIQWEHLEKLLVGDLEDLYEAPEEGTLGKIALAHLVEILTNESTSIELFMGIWDGYKTIDSISNSQIFEIFDQKYKLLTGTTTNITNSVCPDPFYQSPNMIWPEDQSWFIATGVDFRSTYIGCSEISAAALLSEYKESAIQVGPDTKITVT